jgi:hypothetical protein
MDENFLILLYSSSITKKQSLKRLIMPSRLKTCNTVQRGKVGNRLDSESVIKPDIKDNVVSLEVGRVPFISVNLYNVYRK